MVRYTEIPAFERENKKDLDQFEVSLVYIASSSEPAREYKATLTLTMFKHHACLFSRKMHLHFKLFLETRVGEVPTVPQHFIRTDLQYPPSH